MPRRALTFALFVLTTCRPRATDKAASEAPVTPVVAAAPAPPAPSTATPVVGVVAPLPSSEAPRVDIRTIGMHIGGGPNDDVTKAPFLASIAAHHAEFARCFAGLAAAADFGVDARVPAAGGRAKIDRPRSTVKDSAFAACATAVFATIEFLPPKSGAATMVSVSVRGTPR